MTALIRGELIKTVTTRTLFGYAAIGVALAIANVLILTLSEDLVTVADKQEAIAGLPMLLILFGLVGAAGEYRHRTAAPAALAAGGRRGRLLLARAGAYAVTGLVLGTLTVAVALALGLPLLAGEPGPGLGSDEIAPWPREASSPRRCARSWASPPARSCATRSRAWSAR